MKVQLHGLTAALQRPLASTPLDHTTLHPEACDQGAFLWGLGGRAGTYAADLDEWFYEVLAEMGPAKQVANP